MSKPVNITVPDDLFERLRKFKDDLVVSKVCQRALEARVCELEALAGNPLRDVPDLESDPELGSVVERLRRERDMQREAWRTEARHAGIRWAKQAPWPLLQYAATRYRTFAEKECDGSAAAAAAGYGDPGEITIIRDILSAFCRFSSSRFGFIVTTDPGLREEYPAASDGLALHGADAHAVETGFIEGVRAVWEVVRGRI